MYFTSLPRTVLWRGRHKKNPPFAEAGFSILNYLFYTVIPPPLSAGKIMTTTTSVAIDRRTLFKLFFNTEKYFCKYTPAALDYKELFSDP